MTSYFLGIDTGGTFTDGVLIDASTHEVIDTSKTLTTHHDLTICIRKTLDAIVPSDPSRVLLVSISTTLVTNAIAEGKLRPAALFLIGYDPELIRKFRFDENFVTPQYFYFKGGHTLSGQEQAPIDLEGIRLQAETLKKDVEAFAISAYFSPLNSGHEEIACDIVEKATGLPVVAGHQLSVNLDSIKRATTAALNASLLSISHEFISAVMSMLKDRNITAPLMVVRGDGTLMNAHVANTRPVETIHSGPAASAIGGFALSNTGRALVVDIGGTTTDIAMVDNGRVKILDEGTTVGPYRTFVKGMRVRSFGLGGDSHIRVDDAKQMVIGPHRVVPLSYLAHNDPRVAAELTHPNLIPGKAASARRLEYWFLQREPHHSIPNERTRRVIEILRSGPLSLAEILARLKLVNPIQFDGDTLIEEEIVGRAGLTPTDLFHISGDFSPWNIQAAQAAAEQTAHLLKWSLEEFIQAVRSMMINRICAEIIAYITGQSLSVEDPFSHQDSLGDWLFKENMAPNDPDLACEIRLKMPIIGIGAPANLFLPEVAAQLHTQLILPQHYQVANAVGAVTGSVMAVREAEVFPYYHDNVKDGYHVRTGREQRWFSDYEEALKYGRDESSQQASLEAEQFGAVTPVTELEEYQDAAETVHIRARSIGKPALLISERERQN
jgi:N-methylhydantoinase A/oxoprolinase/acetone carboxylase beta subunit